MAFEPFGCRFEVRSALSPDAAKAAIRSRTRGWFDAKDGARGWIVGSLICLQSENSRNPPMIVGRILRDGLGTKIIGRAGHPGSIATLGLIPLLVWLSFADPNPSHARAYFLIQVFLVAIISLVLWMSHMGRRSADPLVRFLSETVGNPKHKPQPAPPELTAKFPTSLTLEIDGSLLGDPATSKSIRDALCNIGDGGFVILSATEDTYIQTAVTLGRYAIEKRDGDDRHFFRAARRGTPDDDNETFTFEETLAVFLAYGSGAPIPSFLKWKPTQP